MMPFLKAISQTIAFLLELCMVFTLGYCGFYMSDNKILRIVLAIVLPLIAIFLWGYFAAPKSKHRLPTAYRIVFELTLYFITAFLLYKTGVHTYACILAGTAVLSESFALTLININSL